MENRSSTSRLGIVFGMTLINDILSSRETGLEREAGRPWEFTVSIVPKMIPYIQAFLSMSSVHPLGDDGQEAKKEFGFPGGGVFYASKPVATSSTTLPLKRETLYLGRLDRIIDRLLELFEQWERQDVFPASIRPDMIHRARLATHEWIAHLVQHASFTGRVPQIALSVWVEEERLCCRIADNSGGFFPMEAYFEGSPEDRYEVMPEQGMKWLIIRACARGLAYRPLGNQGYELAFFVS